MSKPTDYVFDWMIKNLPPEKWGLKTYVEINWMGSMTVEEVLNDGELAADLPKELFRITPGSELVQ